MQSGCIPQANCVGMLWLRSVRKGSSPMGFFLRTFQRFHDTEYLGQPCTGIDDLCRDSQGSWRDLPLRCKQAWRAPLWPNASGPCSARCGRRRSCWSGAPTRPCTELCCWRPSRPESSRRYSNAAAALSDRVREVAFDVLAQQRGGYVVGVTAARRGDFGNISVEEIH